MHRRKPPEETASVWEHGDRQKIDSPHLRTDLLVADLLVDGQVAAFGVVVDSCSSSFPLGDDDEQLSNSRLAR